MSGLTLIITLCLVFFSCQKEEITSIKEPFDFEQIGIEHNKGLDYVFEYLKKEGVGKTSNLKSATNIFDLTKVATLSYAKTSEIFDGIDYDKLPLIYQDFDGNKLKSAGVDELATSIGSEIELSSSQTFFLNELDKAISNLEIGLQPTIEKIKEIELDITNQCTQEESIVLLSSTSIARYALEYWVNNYEDWLNELGGIDISAINKSGLKSANSSQSWLSETLGAMGKSDVVGGAIGAGVGALAGGVGAAPGAVAGACYSSAGRGIVALLDHWEVW